MFKFFKNILCFFFVIGSTGLAASHGNSYVKSHEDMVRNDKIALIERNTNKIFERLSLQRIKKPLYPSWMNTPTHISFSKDPLNSVTPINLIYYADMIKRSYAAPIYIDLDLTETRKIVRTAEELLPHDFIAEFVGNVVKNSKNQLRPLRSRESVMRQKTNPDETWIIDTSEYCNELRFMNASAKDKEPNCQFLDILGQDGLAHVICVALRRIHPKEELTYRQACSEDIITPENIVAEVKATEKELSTTEVAQNSVNAIYSQAALNFAKK